MAAAAPLCHYPSRMTPLARLLLALSLPACFVGGAQAQPLANLFPLPVRVTVDPAGPAGRIPADFLGFGYETSAVAQSNYFRADNATLVQLYRNLGAEGLIRIGGNISDHTQFLPAGPAAPHTEHEVTILSGPSLVDFAAFVKATGWRVMWGLNLGTGSPEEAAREATAVTAALGTSLQSLEIGNEVDLQGGYTRKYPNFEAYHADYLAYKAAIRAALPAAAFSGPDSANNLGWVRAFAAAEAGDVQLLTYHYYRSGAMRPDATLQTLLGGDPGWGKRLDELRTISHEHHSAYRINEVNSFYGGGKAGVSDTFASALWALDYLYVLATHGCAGVNLETDVNQLGWISHYSPIVHDPTGRCQARPEYYAMLAFAQAAPAELLPLQLDTPGVNLSAYATRSRTGRISVTLINRDLDHDAAVTLSGPVGATAAEALWLRAPSPAFRDDVTFAGGSVQPDGTWAPGPRVEVTAKDGRWEIQVPRSAAVVLRWRP